MSTDPRSLNYPTLDDRDMADDELAGSAAPEATKGEHPDRRTGTSDELKELDRAERRKK